MAEYLTFPWTRPALRVSLDAINAALRAADPTAGVVDVARDNTTISVKTGATWTPARIAAAQTILDTVGEWTDRQRAQRNVDAWPLEYRALVLALIDALNVVRAALPAPLPPITPGQALASIRAKAGTL